MNNELDLARRVAGVALAAITGFALATIGGSVLFGCGGGQAESAPPQMMTTTTTTTTGATSTEPAQMSNIVETATNAGNFKTLVSALKEAGLDATLAGPGPFTVFAPTDEAFANLPAGKLDELMKPENKEKLRSILTYHVLSGKVMSGGAAKLTTTKTLQGEDLTLGSSAGGVLTVNGARITQADIECSNGVIHVIDTVLMPK